MNISEAYKRRLLTPANTLVSYVPDQFKNEFLLVGGASLVALGCRRYTEDLDIAITTESLAAFTRSMENHFPNYPRPPSEGGDHDAPVYKTHGGNTIFRFRDDVEITIDFLLIGSDNAPWGILDHVQLVDNLHLPGLASLVTMKNKAWHCREDPKDFGDIVFLVDKMKTEGKDVANVQILDGVRNELRGIIAKVQRKTPRNRNKFQDLFNSL